MTLQGHRSGSPYPPRFISVQPRRDGAAGDEWPHEMKIDGYRWMEKDQSIAGVGEATSPYLDGEVCAIRTDGTTSFAELQAATDHLNGAADIFSFDLLFDDLMEPLLMERKDRLKALLRRAQKNSYFVEHVMGNAQPFYDATFKHDGEGIVPKRVDARMGPATAASGARRDALLVRGNSLSSASQPER
jgi:ATP-dependent DNA ligase